MFKVLDIFSFGILKRLTGILPCKERQAGKEKNAKSERRFAA
jgi:hypothetical protein